MTQLVTRDEAIDVGLSLVKEFSTDANHNDIAEIIDEVHQHTVFDEVAAERERQDEKWGPVHDDTHTTKAFLDFIHDKKTETTLAWFHQRDPDVRKRLIQIAALAIAAVESIDRTSVTKGPTSTGEKQ